MGLGRELPVIGNLTDFPDAFDRGAVCQKGFDFRIARQRFQRQEVIGEGNAGEARLIGDLIERVQQAGKG